MFAAVSLPFWVECDGWHLPIHWDPLCANTFLQPYDSTSGSVSWSRDGVNITGVKEHDQLLTSLHQDLTQSLHPPGLCRGCVDLYQQHWAGVHLSGGICRSRERAIISVLQNKHILNADEWTKGLNCVIWKCGYYTPSVINFSYTEFRVLKHKESFLTAARYGWAVTLCATNCLVC